MKNIKLVKVFASIIIAAVVVAIGLIFAGTIGWLCGFAGGWFLEQFIGGPVTIGLNMVLGNICNHVFVETDIPYVMATLGLIGGCLFKSVRSSGSKKKELDESTEDLKKSFRNLVNSDSDAEINDDDYFGQSSDQR